MADTVEFVKNENKDVRIKVTEVDGGTVTISNAEYTVYDTDGTTVQATASATIANSGTTEATITGAVDTSTSDFALGSAYQVNFKYVIGSETYIKAVTIRIVET